MEACFIMRDYMCVVIWVCFNCLFLTQAETVKSDRNGNGGSTVNRIHRQHHTVIGVDTGPSEDHGVLESKTAILQHDLEGYVQRSNSQVGLLKVKNSLPWIQGNVRSPFQWKRHRRKRSVSPSHVTSDSQGNSLNASGANSDDSKTKTDSKERVKSANGQESLSLKNKEVKVTDPVSKGKQITGNSMKMNGTILNATEAGQKVHPVDSPNSKSSNQSLPVFYRNRSQDVTSATVCVSAILVLMFGIILYSRMWRRRDQWLSMSVTLGESQEPRPDPITPSTFSIKDVIEGKMKLIQAQFRQIQKRQSNGVHKVQKNGHYKRIPVRADSEEKSDSEDEVYTR